MGNIKCWVCVSLKGRDIKFNISFIFSVHIHVLGKSDFGLVQKRWKCFKCTWFDRHCCSINGIWRWTFSLHPIYHPIRFSFVHCMVLKLIKITFYIWHISLFFKTDLLYTLIRFPLMLFVRRSTTCFMVKRTFYVYLFFLVYSLN